MRPVPAVSAQLGQASLLQMEHGTCQHLEPVPIWCPDADIEPAALGHGRPAIHAAGDWPSTAAAALQVRTGPPPMHSVCCSCCCHRRRRRWQRGWASVDIWVRCTAVGRGRRSTREVDDDACRANQRATRCVSGSNHGWRAPRHAPCDWRGAAAWRGGSAAVCAHAGGDGGSGGRGES